MNSVKSVIDNWDPMEILMISPNDEYVTEIQEIEQLLNVTSDEYELGEKIYNIFVYYFDKNFHKSLAECIVIARQILDKSSKTI